MVVKKKTGKGRLDKYYHLAKEQGYRARSAFKLVQLNKKYNFLEKSRVLVDLCAAPGGWLQVACKYMPVSHLIIGIDLAPIKPIPNVMTFQADITTEKCRSELKKHLKTWDVDVFLHDGAPNVGSAWVQDAYSQSELVLKATKLACEFLRKGGDYVTKVFRSKDYNSLIWVFNQLFDKVEATKPASSRNVSAEIFVVCRGYKAPQRLDPKFFDIKHVFQELDFVEKPLNIFKPDKHIRKRGGYEDGVTLLFKKCPASEFIESDDPVKVLGTSNCIVFESAQDLMIKALSCTKSDDDVLAFCEDLKVLGKKDYKHLLNWRKKVRTVLDIKEDSNDAEDAEDAEKQEDQDQQDHQDMTEEDKLEMDLLKLSKDEQKLDKRKKRKILLKKAKARLRASLGMNAGDDVADDLDTDGLFDLRKITKKKNIEALEKSDEMDDEMMMMQSDDDEDLAMMKLENVEDDSNLESSDNDDDDDDHENRIAELEKSLAIDHRNYKDRLIEKDPKLRVKAARTEAGQNYDDEFVPFSDREDEFDDDDDDEEEEEDQGDDKNDENEEANPLVKTLEPLEQIQERKAALWFSQPIFKEFESNQSESNQESSDATTLSKSKNGASNKFAKEHHSAKKRDPSAGFEIVKAVEFDEETKSSLLSTPAGMTMALQMLDKKAKRDLIDDSYNRYSFNDLDDLPEWFVEDEKRHNRPQKQVTKEAVALARERQKTLDARPIKKVIEARARAKKRANRKIERMKSRAQVVVDDADLNDKQKLEAIQKMMRKASSESKSHKKPSLVVAKGGRRGLQGRPKGVKGRYKMVDKRMKKEKRAEKRIAKSRK